MPKVEKSLIPEKNESIISKIFKFIKNIFGNGKNKTISLNEEDENAIQSSTDKKDFISSVSFRENEETNILIEKIKKDNSILYNMDMEELIALNERINEKQKFLDKKIETLKMEIIRQKKINSSLS